MREQHQAVGVGEAVVEDHRRREVAQHRGHGVGRHVEEAVRRLGLGQHQHAFQRRGLGRGFSITLDAQRQLPAVAREQREAHRDHERLAFDRRAHALRCAEVLRQRQRDAAVGRGQARGDLGRARLRVPALELVELHVERAGRVDVGDGLRERVAGDGLAVVAAEVLRDAALEAGAAHQRLHHAHELGALLIHGGGVEVVDGHVAVRAHRVRHRARVLGELHLAQEAHVVDALDAAGRGRAGHVLRELLVAEDGEAFLERELEPVAAGDAVAGPVVEVLVADDALDQRVVDVGGGGGAGQHELGVEQVQALVLHRAHVEVFDRHDHEALEVQGQAEARLVPHQRGHERVHRVLGLVEVAAAHEHLQQVLLAGAAGDALLARDQVGGHQREQVRGLRERVVPAREVAAVVQRALFLQVAVGQQHRVLRLVGAQRDGVDRHHVGAIEEVGDAAEALGLALREEAAARGVQARQLGVLLGADRVADLEHERFGGRGVDHQLVVLVAERHALAVDEHAQQVQALAVQAQRLGRALRVAFDRQLARDDGLGGIEVERQVDGADPVGGRRVVLTADQLRRAFAHGFFLLFGWETKSKTAHGSWPRAGTDHRPCLRLAAMNWSRSPSSTFWVAEVSTLVRRSLMRLWSSTYERIW